jgi:hypothetical protein
VLKALTVGACVLSLALFAWGIILVTTDESSHSGSAENTSSLNPPATSYPLYPSGPAILTAEEANADREEWLEEQRQAALNATPHVRTSVTIRGQEIDLPVGMRVIRESSSAGGGSYDKLGYGDRSSRGAWSELAIDARDGTIRWIQVLPEHVTLFDPFVQATGGWPSPTPVPTPIVVRLGDHDFVLPDGMEYYPPNAQYPHGAAVIVYPEPMHFSRVYINANGELVESQIFPDHMDEFAPVLAEFPTRDE